MMKLGIMSGAYLDRYGLQEGLARMRAHGYECVDYDNFCDTTTPLFQGTEAEFEHSLIDVRTACADAGIQISQTHGPWRWPPRDSTEEDRAERLEKMIRSVRGTAILGCPYMVIHPIMPFGCNRDPEPERMWAMNYDFMRKLADAGQEYGVTVCYENMPMPALSIATPEAVLRFVKTLDHPNFRVCLDTGHCAVCGRSVGEAVRLLGREYLRVLHVHDNNGRGDFHWLPYEGIIDWDDFAAALQEIGFDGTLSLETHVSKDLPDGDERTAAELKLFDSAKRLAGRTL